MNAKAEKGLVIFGVSLGLAMIIFLIGLAVASIALTIYGIYLTFCASVVLGILVIFIEPAPLVIAVIYLAFNYNIPEHLLQLFQG